MDAADRLHSLGRSRHCRAFTFHGTHQGNFMGIPATGRRIAVKGVVIDRVVDGKWKDSRILMDNLALLQQLGVLPQTLTAVTA